MLMSAAAVWALCATGALAQTDIEFIQWWEPEMPAGALRGIMDDFEAANPDIKVTLVSGPYSATHDQIVVGAASGTLSDVVGLDGAWVNGLAKQGAIASMDPLMDAANYDRSQIADIIKVDGKSVMFPLASFVYPVFVNLDLAKAAGVESMPTNRTEFADAAKKMTDADKNQFGWVLPLSLETPNGIQNDVMAWVWASGRVDAEGRQARPRPTRPSSARSSTSSRSTTRASSRPASSPRRSRTRSRSSSTAASG